MSDDRTLRNEVADLVPLGFDPKRDPYANVFEAADAILAHVAKRVKEHAGDWNGDVYEGVSGWPDGEAHGYGTGIDEVLEILGSDIPGTERTRSLPTLKSCE